MDPMLSQALRTTYGPFGDFAKKAAKNPDVWHTAFTRFLRGEDPWARKADAEKGILRFESSLLVEARNPFVARDHFRADMSPSASVKISHLGADFQEHFLPVVEEDVEPVTLVRHSVLDSGINIPRVFWTLRERHEVKLAHLWEALRKQRNGEYAKGAGLLYHERNFLFIFDKDRVLWVVYVRLHYYNGKEWVKDGWAIDAVPFCEKVFPDLYNCYPNIISSVK